MVRFYLGGIYEKTEHPDKAMESYRSVTSWQSIYSRTDQVCATAEPEGKNERGSSVSAELAGDE